jgi:hypothetical protein
MARRLVLIPVPPKVTASLAAYLRGTCESASAFKIDWRLNQTAPSPAVAMNSLRFMDASLRRTILVMPA